MELLHQAHDLISPFGELVTTESPVVATIALSNMATCVEIRLPVPVVVWLPDAETNTISTDVQNSLSWGEFLNSLMLLLCHVVLTSSVTPLVFLTQ